MCVLKGGLKLIFWGKDRELQESTEELFESIKIEPLLGSKVQDKCTRTSNFFCRLHTKKTNKKT